MKNITVLWLLVIMSTAAYSQDLFPRSTYRLSAGPQFGFVWGRAFEYVYPSAGEAHFKDFLSKLIWEMKPVFYSGIQFEFSRRNIMEGIGFFSRASFKFGNPADSGRHKNRDWRSKENSALTDSSSHINKTREFYWMDAAVGMSFPIRSFLYLKPFINVSIMRFAFSGRDGHGVYARCKCSSAGSCGSFYPIGDNPNLAIFHGEVIRYEQTWLSIGAGFTVGTKILYPFIIDLSFHITPFNICNARDDHLEATMYFNSERLRTRSVTFYDFTRGGLGFAPSLSISYALNNLKFTLEAAYRHNTKTRGPSYNDERSPGIFRQSGEGGGSYSLFDFRFLLRITL